MARRTLLLDLDGTLWDSRPWYAEILARVAGGSAVEHENRLATGTSVVELARELRVTKTRLAREACASVETLELYGDARETLDRLRERATRMAVVTNLPGWLALPVATAVGIEGYFAAIVTASRGVPAKPQPHGIRRALTEMGRETDSHTWLVGDGAADAGAAARAGVRFAWAAYGYETAQPSGAETVLQSFEDVLCL